MLMRPLGGPHQPGNHIKRGALARSVRSEKPGHVARLDLRERRSTAWMRPKCLDTSSKASAGGDSIMGFYLLPGGVAT